MRFNTGMKINVLKFVCLLVLLCCCRSVTVPSEFVYREIQTTTFKLATWQKITQPGGRYKIYIEGDGYAFSAYGQPTSDPTPHGTLMRELAFGDDAPNVVYLARPCQYVADGACVQKYWTTARFAPEVVTASREAVRRIAGQAPVVLIGFSGGAQVAGLIAVRPEGLRVEKVVTIAGNVDHREWTAYHHLPPLDESENLADYRATFRALAQAHFVGEDDDVVPAFLVRDFVGNDALIHVVKGATHNTGYQTSFPKIYAE